MHPRRTQSVRKAGQNLPRSQMSRLFRLQIADRLHHTPSQRWPIVHSDFLDIIPRRAACSRNRGKFFGLHRAFRLSSQRLEVLQNAGQLSELLAKEAVTVKQARLFEFINMLHSLH